jgi:hypothetical protein
MNLKPTTHDRLAFFSLSFHHFFKLSPEEWPEFYQKFMGHEVPQLIAPVAIVNPTKALLYGKGIEHEEPLLLSALQQFLQIRLPNPMPGTSNDPR